MTREPGPREAPKGHCCIRKGLKWTIGALSLRKGRKREGKEEESRGEAEEEGRRGQRGGEVGFHQDPRFWGQLGTS